MHTFTLTILTAIIIITTTATILRGIHDVEIVKCG